MEGVFRVALYVRVSSDKQDTDLSISAQLRSLREFAAKHGYRIVFEYVDEAESGKSIHRPSFKAMISAARQKVPPFEAVLVWKLSRFARNREDSIIYKSLLRKHGIQVISINEPLEDSPSGRLLEGIIEVIDEFYSANLSQDVVRGMRENASRGFFPGGTVPYGFRRLAVADNERTRTKLAPDPSTAPVVVRIFRECLEDQGLKEIAKGLNRDGLTTATGKEWSPTSVHNVLRNEAYVGTLVWDRRKKRQHSSKESFPPVRVEGAWAGMIDQRTFNVARKKLASRAPLITHPRVVNSQYLLTGMIRCKGCGTAMTGMSAKSGRFLYYVCNNKRRKGKGLCKTPLLPKQKMESFVIERIRDNILTAETLEELTRLVNEEIYQYKHENEEELSLIQTQIDEIDGRLGKLYDALETGSFKPVQLAPRVEALTEKKARLEQWKADTEAKSLRQALELASIDVIDAYVNDLRALLEESSIMEQKAFLRSFIQSLEVAETDLTITYTIPIDTLNSGEGVTEDATVLPTIKTGSPGGEPYSATLFSYPALEVGLRPDQSFAWSEEKAP